MMAFCWFSSDVVCNITSSMHSASHARTGVIAAPYLDVESN